MPYPNFVHERRAAAGPARCWYCPEPATVVCTEKIVSPWIALPGELERYALIQDTDLNWYIVSRVQEVSTSTPGCPWLNDTVFEVTIVRRGHGDKTQEAVRVMRPLLPLLELRSEPCGRSACDRHVRDLGDGAHFRCLEHWYENAPRPAGELELARLWQGLLETTIKVKRKDRHAK